MKCCCQRNCDSCSAESSDLWQVDRVAKLNDTKLSAEFAVELDAIEKALMSSHARQRTCVAEALTNHSKSEELEEEMEMVRQEIHKEARALLARSERCLCCSCSCSRLCETGGHGEV